MWTRQDLKSKGKAAFKANYWKCVLVAVIISALTTVESRTNSNETDLKGLMTSGAQQAGVSLSTFVALVVGVVGVGLIIALAIELLLKNVLVVGCSGFFVKNSDTKAELKEIGTPFKRNYKNVVIAMFLQDLFIFLWSLLLVIPGIIKAYEYRMIPYLLADNPDMTWQEAFAESKRMMTGNKWNAFVLDLSFIGWYILGAITAGIVLVFWTAPYQLATDAELYKVLKNNR